MPGMDGATLLNEVARLVSNHPEKYNEVLSAVRAGDRTIAEAERAIFGTTHAEVGSYLLWLWGLPDPVVEAVAFHHSPSQCPSAEFAPLTAVYVANMLEHAPGGNIDAADASLDTAYLARIGAADAVPAWSSIFREQAASRDAI